MFKRVLTLILGMVFLFTFASCDVNDKKNDDNKGPEATPTPEPTSEAEGKTVLYQVVPEKLSLMMCYVIKTKHDKLIVIDGGIDGHGLNAPAYLLEELQEISGQDHPVIDAWFITHAHYDHYYEFVKMVEQKKDQFTVNNVYFNFPSDDFIKKYEPNGEPYMDRFRAAYNTLFGENAYQEYEGVKVGDIIEVDNVKFEILQIPDEKITANAINNSSLIFRMEVEGQTVLFTGDAGVEAGNRLIKTYGDNIQSDFVQMSHHGQAGLNKSHYKKINAKVCLWPIPEWVWVNKDKLFSTDETKKWMFRDFGVEHHYISGLYGTESIEFPFDFEMEPKNNVDWESK